MKQFLNERRVSSCWIKTSHIKLAAREHGQFALAKLKTLAPRLVGSIFIATTIGAQAQSFNVPGNTNWVSAMDLPPRTQVNIVASGRVTPTPIGASYDATGIPGSISPTDIGFPHSTNKFGLVARLTASRSNPFDEVSETWAYGTTRSYCAVYGGHLWLIVNDAIRSDNGGAFAARVTTSPGCSAPPPPSPPTLTPGDLSAQRIEVTQSIQEPNSGVPLLSLKKTIVRVSVRTDGRGDPWSDVTGILTVRNISGGIYGDRIFSGRTHRPTISADSRGAISTNLAGSRRDELTTTLNFELDEDETAVGERDLDVDVRTISGRRDTNSTNNRLVKRVRFERPLNAFVPAVNYRTSLLPAAPRSDLEPPRRVAESIMPLTNLWLGMWPGNPIPTFDIGPPCPAANPGCTRLNPWDQADAWAADLLDRTFRDGGQRLFVLQPDPDTGYNGTQTNTGRGNKVARTTNNQRDPGPTMAHELAHSWDLCHSPNIGAENGCRDLSYPRANGALGAQVGINTHVGPFGWGVVLQPGRDAAGSDIRGDVMSYTAPYWISPYSYCKLIDAFVRLIPSPTGLVPRCDAGARLAIAPVPLPKKENTMLATLDAHSGVLRKAINPRFIVRTSGLGGEIEYLRFSGWIFADGSATLRPSEIVTLNAPPPPQKPGGAYTLSLESTNGKALSSYGFNLPARQDAVKRQPHFFSGLVKYDPATARVALLKKTKVLTEQKRSPNPPVAVLLNDPTGKLMRGSYKLAWDATDMDGDILTYYVDFSSDGGRSWMALSGGQSGATSIVNFDQLPGSKEARLRVVVTDGINTAAATSGIFEVARKRPQLSINVPGKEFVVSPQALPTFEVRAFDWEDGPIDNPLAYSWSIDGVAKIQIGRRLNVGHLKLPTGRHTIGVTVTDSDKNTERRTVNFTIAGK
jgi:hypothetical protein